MGTALRNKTTTREYCQCSGDLSMQSTGTWNVSGRGKRPDRTKVTPTTPARHPHCVATAAADSLQVSQQASGANSRQNSGPPSPGIAAEGVTCRASVSDPRLAGKGSRFGRFSVSLKAKLQSLKDGNSGGPTSPTSSGPSIDVSRKTSRSSSVNAGV